MNLRKLTILAFFASLLISCSGDDEPAPGLQGGDYLPIATGNRWEYGGAIGYTVEFTGNTQNFNSRVYAEAETSSFGDTTLSYISVENGIYTSLGFLPTADEVEFIILKDNVPEGTTWEERIEVSGIATVYKFSIGDKGISHTVEGEVFNDVIRVRMETFIEAFGVNQLVAGQDIYFARDIGIIQTDLGPVGSSDLIDFTIN